MSATNPISGLPSVQNYDALNNNQNSFNTTNLNQNFTLPNPSRRNRRVSITTTLACVEELEDPSCRLPAVQIKVLDLESTHCSNSPTPDEITPVAGGKSVNEHAMPVKLTSEASFHQASASEFQEAAQRGNVKRRSLLPKAIMSLSALVARESRKVLWPIFQPTNPEKLKLWTDFNIGEVDDYVPEGMDNKYKNYMRSRHLGQINAIPVWNPSPIRGVNVRRRIRIDVGDVGTFTRRGGFRVAFNILLKEQTNISCGYNVPKNFSRFVPPLTCEQAQSCSIKDDGIMIDLDNCGAIDSEEINQGALSYGFKQRPFKSSWMPFTTRCDISPEAKKDKRRGYIFLPHGAKIYSFSSRSTEDLTAYLNECLPDWLEYLERLSQREKAPPILLTAVWAARSFACATYTVNPPNSSAIAQVWTTPKGEKIYWGHASEGFETAHAPLDDGYDGNAKLKSQVENQCFAIEGYVLKSLKKEISKWRASLPVL